MLVKTHVVGGIAAGMALAAAVPVDPLITLGAAAVGSVLPDICHSGSFIGKKAKPLARVISLLFGHRTITHSLLFLAAAAWLLNSVEIPDAAHYGVLVGMASHLLLDAATKNGIKLFYPLRTTVRLPLTIRTGGAFEPVVLFALALAAIYFGVQVFEIR